MDRQILSCRLLRTLRIGRRSERDPGATCGRTGDKRGLLVLKTIALDLSESNLETCMFVPIREVATHHVVSLEVIKRDRLVGSPLDCYLTNGLWGPVLRHRAHTVAGNTGLPHVGLRRSVQRATGVRLLSVSLPS